MAATALPTLVLVATSAYAADDSGEIVAPPIGFSRVLGIYFAAPLLILLVIAVLAAAPRLAHRPRYRPGRPWPYDPLWFAGPDDPDRAVAAARPLRGTGGASAEW